MSALSDKCYAIYTSARDGQSAVEEYILKNHPQIRWDWCGACEADEPSENMECLVCGSKTTKEW